MVSGWLDLRVARELFNLNPTESSGVSRLQSI